MERADGTELADAAGFVADARDTRATPASVRTQAAGRATRARAAPVTHLARTTQ